MIHSFQVNLIDFPESPVITRLCNVVELTPFIDFHSLRTVLTVSDQISPFTQTSLLHDSSDDFERVLAILPEISLLTPHFAGCILGKMGNSVSKKS